MHNFIKLISSCLVCCVFAGCSSGRAYTSDIISYKSDDFSIHAEAVSFKQDELSALNSELEDDISLWIEDFKMRVSENRLQPDETPTLNVQTKVYADNSSLVSLVTEKYVYISGAHGNKWWKARCFDKSLRRCLSLSELFSDDRGIDILNRRLEEAAAANPDEYRDLWETPCVASEPFYNFYLDGKSLVIFFQPYELSYYAKGVVTFRLEAPELRGYLKEEYLKMLR